MPDKQTIKKAQELKEEGKSASTQAGEFVRAEIDKIREGEHGARSTKQAIAIGLSEARRAGVDLPAPKKGKYSDDVREKAKQDLERGREEPNATPSPTRSKAIVEALQKEGKDAVSHAALSKQARATANKRTVAERSAIGKKAAASRTPEERSASAQKGAETRRKKAG